MTDLTAAKPLVLIVDDEPSIVRIVQVNLERAGYATEMAYDGQQALDYLLSDAPRPALILLDVMMPYMDGFALLDRVKADDRLRDIPVVMMTARSQNADMLEGTARGAEIYLTKPISIAELQSVVRLHTQEPASEAGSETP